MCEQQQDQNKFDVILQSVDGSAVKARIDFNPATQKYEIVKLDTNLDSWDISGIKPLMSITESKSVTLNPNLEGWDLSNIISLKQY
jgi:hypothetical protein